MIGCRACLFIEKRLILHGELHYADDAANLALSNGNSDKRKKMIANLSILGLVVTPDLRVVDDLARPGRVAPYRTPHEVAGVESPRRGTRIDQFVFIFYINNKQDASA